MADASNIDLTDASVVRTATPERDVAVSFVSTGSLTPLSELGQREHPNTGGPGLSQRGTSWTHCPRTRSSGRTGLPRPCAGRPPRASGGSCSGAPGAHDQPRCRAQGTRTLGGPPRRARPGGRRPDQRQAPLARRRDVLAQSCPRPGRAGTAARLAQGRTAQGAAWCAVLARSRVRRPAHSPDDAGHRRTVLSLAG